MVKPLTTWIAINWKIIKEMGIPDYVTCLLRNLYVSQEVIVRILNGTTDWLKLGKEFSKAVYCHPVYLTSMQSTSWEILGWMNHSSVQFSHSVMSDSLQRHESQHTRPLCPSPTPGVHSYSRPLSPWCHPAISSLVVPFSSCPQSLPASESFPMSQLFAWGGQSIGVSALASVLPKNTRADLL